MNENQRKWLFRILTRIDKPVRFVIRISDDTVISVNGRLCAGCDDTSFNVRNVDSYCDGAIRYARFNMKDITDYCDEYEHANGPMIAVDMTRTQTLCP